MSKLPPLIGKARAFAANAHAGQKYGDKPFIVHLMDVARLAAAYNLKNFVIIAAWLHDTLEDTDTKFEELMIKFGPDVAWLVEAVTDEPGGNRKERAHNTLPKIRKVGSNAVGLKLCDRISNVQAAIRDKHTLLKAYKKEYPEFKEILYKESEHEKLWDHLDALLLEQSGAVTFRISEDEEPVTCRVSEFEDPIKGSKGG